MKVKSLYDQGSAVTQEDALICQPPYFFGAVDGVSGLYLPANGPKIFEEGRSGGQMAAHALSSMITAATSVDRLSAILLRANFKIQRTSETAGLNIEESEHLPGCGFAVAKVSETVVDIFQGADCLAIWRNKDGSLGGTPNRMHGYESDIAAIVHGLMSKHGQDRQKMWLEFVPIVAEKRRTHINKPKGNFAVMNGQSRMNEFWQIFTIPKKDLETLILFSDGFVPLEWTGEPNALAKKVFERYDNPGGLHAMLRCTRQLANAKKNSSHEDLPEATAIALEF